MAARHTCAIALLVTGFAFSNGHICTFTDIMDSKGLDHTLMDPVERGHNLEVCKEKCLNNPGCWSVSFSAGYCYEFAAVEYEFLKRGILSRKSCDGHDKVSNDIINNAGHDHDDDDHDDEHSSEKDLPLKYASQCDGGSGALGVISLACHKSTDGGDKIHIVRANYGRNDTSGEMCNPLWETQCKGHQIGWNGGKAHECDGYKKTCIMDVHVVFEHDCEAQHNCALKQEHATFNKTVTTGWCGGSRTYSEVWYQCADDVVLDHSNHKRKCWKH